jgi:glycosyltransferase involved in cell wall biosynthesis
LYKKIITHINFAKGFRGGERQTLLLIEELSRRGYTQTIFTRVISQLATKLDKVENLTIIKINKPYIFNISKIKNSSIIHAHETKGAQFAYFANLIYKIPYIITRRVDNPIKNNFFNKAIYENSTYTIALSNAIKSTLTNISQNIDIKIIPSAYSKLTIDKTQSNNIKQRFEDKFILGNIGELDNAHKGQYYLIEAMKKLQLTHPNIHLILLGKGCDEQNYKEQSKDLTNITFEGFVSNVGDYIQCFDIFVFPSLHEGLGSILFDIMQSNIPIIATNTGGIPDIITNDKNGILVPIKNSDAIYNAIIKLYNDKGLREKLANEALKDIDNYSFETMTNKYETIYKEII